MPNNKVSEAQAIYIGEIRRVQETAEKWRDFLDFAAQAQISENQSEFEFSSKLIIHARNPNAKDCRPFGEWKTEDGNHVSRLERGIPVLSRDSRGNQSVTYLFDTSQTALKKEPERIEIPEEMRENLKSALSGIIKDFSDNTSLSDVQKRIFAETAEYKLCKQYGLETAENPERFSGIEKLSVKEIANIGVALNRCSNSFAETVKNERSNFNERGNNSQSRDDRTELYGQERRGVDLGQGVSGTRDEVRLRREHERMEQTQRGEHDIRTADRNSAAEADSGNGQVRQYETEIHMADPVPVGDTSHGQSGEALRGNERESSEPDREHSGEEKAVGGIQGDRGNGEIPAESADTGEVQSRSGGGNTSRDGLRDITEETAEPEKVSAVSVSENEQSDPFENFKRSKDGDIILGNTTFRYIPEKTYTQIDKDIAVEVSEQLEKQGIKFSGVIKGDTATITVSKPQKETLDRIIADISSPNKDIAAEESIDTPELTDKEKAFLDGETAPLMAKDVLAWDEIEDIGYRLYEKGYIDRHAPSEKAIYGNGLNEPVLYDMAKRMQNGEDIGKELSLALLGNQRTFDINIFDEFNVEYGSDFITAKFGNAEKQVSYEELENAFFKLFKDEYDDIVHGRTVEDLRDIFPDITGETADNLINAFDGAIMHGWQDNEVVQRKIKKALYNILGDKENTEKAFSSIADMKYNVKISNIGFFSLGNGVTVCDTSRMDKETNDYVKVAHISPEGVLTMYDNSVSQQDMASIRQQVNTVRDEFVRNWNSMSRTQQFEMLLDRADITTQVNISKDSISMEEKIEKYMPYVFFKKGERPEPQTAEQNNIKNIEFIGERDSFEAVKAAARTQSFGTTVTDGNRLSIVMYDNADVDEVRKLLETAQENNVFETVETAKMLEDKFGAVFSYNSQNNPTVADLSAGDVILYEGKRREVEKISENSISLKDLDAPDFGGILLGTSDVLAYKGWQEDMNEKGFEILSKAKTYSEITRDMYQTENPDIFTVKGKGSFAKIDITVNAELWERLAEKGLVRNENSVDRVIFNIDNKEWNKLVIPDKWGNMTNNINIEDVFTSEELQTAKSVADFVIGNEDIQQVLDNFNEDITPVENNTSFSEEISGSNGTVKYKVTENADEQYKYNVQIFTQGENGEFYYSGLGRFCETLDEAHAFIENDIAERTAAKDRQHSDKDEITGNDEYNISQGQMSLFDDIPDIEEIPNERNYQVVTYSRDLGADDKKIFSTLDEAVESGRGYLYDKEHEGYYSGIAILNTKEQKVEYYEGDFPLEGIFSEQVYQNSGNWQRAEPIPNLLFDKFDEHYNEMYKNHDEVNGYDEAVAVGDKFIRENPDIMERIANSRNDVITSDREAAALAFALADVGMIDKFVEPEQSKQQKVQQNLVTSVHTEQSPLNPERVTVTHSEAAKVPDIDVEKPEEKKTNNLFRITDEHLGEGGKKEKFRNNIEAIKTLQILEAEERAATPEEQETLSKYIGWGGLQEAFDNSLSAWDTEYRELKNLLSEEEYEAARSTVNDAFYTSPVITQAIYEGLANIGFNGGEVLEPSMGVGNFFGTMPDKMRENSNLSGIEIDSISGRIAKKLYPEADIAINGYENIKLTKGSFDLAVGNVPFGNHGVNDKTKAYKGLLIHDYFFAKSLDSVRSGGIVAFVTSTGTLDKDDTKVRQMLAQKAELLGAVRLPNNAFQKNAGTQTATDIIFLKKREKPLNISEMPMDKSCEWVHTKENADGLKINSYFADNPEMVLGELSDKGRFGSIICTPVQGADLKEQLHEAMKNIKGEYVPLEFQQELDERAENNYLTATPDIENLTYTVVDDKLYFRVDDNLIPLKESEQHGVTADRRKGLCDLGLTVRELLKAQVEDRPDKEIKLLQAELNVKYDKFVQKFGRINPTETPNSRNASGVTRKAPNSNVFKNDVRLPLLQSLEKMKEGQFVGKTEIFTERTIRPRKVAEHVETAHEALILSISEKGKIDFDYMQDLTGFEKEKIVSDLHGDIYPVPELSTEDNTVYQTSDEYLSGNIYKKIAMAEAKISENPAYAENVAALTEVIPKPLKATEIDMQLGMTWIDTKIIQQFMYETFETPQRFKEYDGDVPQENPSAITVHYSGAGKGSWKVENACLDNSVKSTKNFGTKDLNAYELLEKILNAKSVAVTQTVRDEEGRQKTVILEKQTKAAEDKVKQINAAFKKWIFADPERRNELVKTYNEKFNGIRPREYDGSNLNFFGSNPEITLKPHQKNAVAHALFGGNTLFAHQVGAGKTFEMIATAMEGKRLGLHNKSMFVVPNHLTEQIGSDFMKLYPNANILVAKPDDFSPQKRRQMCARIATGNFDAVIIGHSQLIKIPLSAKREEEFIRKQINEVVSALEAAEETDSKSYTVKQLEATRKNLRERLEKLTNGTVKDNAVTFEELGVDKLFVDEAHEFKNLYVSTKMENVSGLSTNADVQKTQDLYMKCQYLDEKTGSKGIVFSTGTPVTNALSEMYTTMKYLQSDLLKETGLDSFDAWAGNFTRKSTEAEISPSGSDWRMKTRLKFTNVPELVTMFKECADVKMADQLNLDVPECEKHIVSVEPTEAQKSVVQSLAVRAEAISKGEVSRTEDNMLVVTGDGRKLGLDQRLYDLNLPDEPQTKLNACIQNVFDIWENTSEKKSTQLVFCDLGVPQSKEDLKKNGERFDVYSDIRSKLIEKGIPEKEIAFIHEANSETEKAKLFAKVRSGDVRVLIGSTQKMGAGTNVQDKLVALHDLDCPWRPADLTQRLGRMVRQGNENKKVDNFRYVTKGTFDAYLYQMVEKKQESISQIFTSKAIARTCDDIDDMAVDLMQVKMAAVGDDRIRRQMELREDIRSLNMLKNTYLENKYEIEDNIKRLPSKIANTEKIIEGIAADTKTVKGYVPKKDIDGQEVFEMKVGNTLYVDKKEAAEALKAAMTSAVMGNPKAQTDIAEYKGFKIAVSYDGFAKSYKGHLKGENIYSFDFGSSESGNLTRIDNAIASVPMRIDKVCNELERMKTELADSIKEADMPFEHEAELEEKKQELERLTDEINADKVKGEIAPEQPESTGKSSEKPEKQVQTEKVDNLNIKWRQNDKELRITYDRTADSKITAYSDGKEIGHCSPDELTVTKISGSEQKKYPDGITKCVEPLNLAFSSKMAMHINNFAERVKEAEKSVSRDDKALFSRDRIMSDDFKPTSEKSADTPKSQSL
ncbi:MAG: SNF2-related protein [Alistipes sp.]|nr:SNF2-related protein [Alistipes sp.]